MKLEADSKRHQRGEPGISSITYVGGALTLPLPLVLSPLSNPQRS